MKNSKSKIKIVQIDWLDHYAKEAGWINLENYVPKLLVMTTVGFLVKETKEVYILSMTEDGKGSVGSLMHILKCCVVRKKCLK